MSNPTDLTQANDPRSRLAAIVAERGLIADHIEQINAADARLISAASPDAAAESELAALDAAASRAIEEWARNGGEGEPPNPDGAKREELLKRASKAQARARAVQGARSKLNDERNAEGRRLAAIEARIDPVVLDVMFAEAEPVIAEFKRLAAAAGEAAWKVVTLKALSIELAHAAEGEVRGELFARMPSFVEFVQGIYPPPSIDDFRRDAAPGRVACARVATACRRR